MDKLLIITFLFFVISCKKGKAKEPEVIINSSEVSFSKDVQPIFVSSCGVGNDCHGVGSQSGGEIFENYTGASAVSDSKILGTIKHLSGFSPMPRSNPPLSAEKISKIEAWINQGKKND